LNTMFSASSSLTWAAVGLPDSRSLRKGCIVIPPMPCYLLMQSVPNWHVSADLVPKRSDGIIRTEASDWNNWTIVLLILRYDLASVNATIGQSWLLLPELRRDTELSLRGSSPDLNLHKDKRANRRYLRHVFARFRPMELYSRAECSQLQVDRRRVCIRRIRLADSWAEEVEAFLPSLAC